MTTALPPDPFPPKHIPPDFQSPMPTSHLPRLSLIFFVLLAALWAIFPQLLTNPRELFDPSIPLSEKHNLKPGIDMVGGARLVYEIKPPSGTAANPDLANTVMEALKKRVDPDGVRNLVWRPHGATTLEIQMPLSGKGGGGQVIKQEFADARTALESTNVSPAVLIDAVTRLTGPERTARLAQLAADSSGRQALFARLAALNDDIATARASKNAEAQAAAELEFDKARLTLDQGNIKVAELEQVLNKLVEEKAKAANDPKFRLNPALAAVVTDAQAVAADSPARKAALERLLKAHAAFQAVKDNLDDSAGLKRLLQGSGVLEFHILVDQTDPRAREMQLRMIPTTKGGTGQGPSSRAGDSARWLEVDKPEQFGRQGIMAEYNGRVFVLVDLRPDYALTATTGQPWALTNATKLIDPQSGGLQVGFSFDAQGGFYFGRLTSQHIGKPMAISLDDKVISAPNINSAITGGTGTITGKYTEAEVRYLVSTLTAGSLPAKLADEPISENAISSSIGQDNLARGLYACAFGLVVVGVFLISYYYLAGLVAFLAVLFNLVLIVGALAALQATFTLPGIAALVLTVGTAVDANVLIFERLREEQSRGLNIRTALRNAYDRAFGAIFDSNVVTAIVSLVLYVLGSEEVKGFGLTLLIGILCSLFTALFVTRTIFGILVDKFGVRKLNSFPTTVPAWDRFLKPSIDWMGKAPIVVALTLLTMLAGLGLFVHYVRAGQMFDIEFAGGTSISFELKQAEKIEEMRAQIASIGEAIIPSPTVLQVNADGKSYEVITPSTDKEAVRTAMLKLLGDKLNIEVPSSFVGVNVPLADVLNKQVLPVGDAPLASWLPVERQADYRGGVAIVLQNLSPALSADDVRQRLDRQRLQPSADVKAVASLPMSVIGQNGSAVGGEIVVLINDEKVPAEADLARWQSDVASPVWKLVNDAVNKPPILSRVNSIGGQVASATRTDAILALVMALVIIMGYVWVRFGNLKYGTANTLALLHDTFFLLAALGFAHLICDSAIGKALLLEPFRINLTVVAGVLTIMAYSMVDTIVVFDRIRELRRDSGHLTRKVINDAINQTLSRTLLTAGTTIVTIAVMYTLGGPGIHGFTFILLVGILVGTYSSIIIAAPMLLIGADKEDRKKDPSAGLPAKSASGSVSGELMGA